ncbi:polysaccharide lyase 6 family protein [Vibrio breoganii]
MKKILLILTLSLISGCDSEKTISDPIPDNELAHPTPPLLNLNRLPEGINKAPEVNCTKVVTTVYQLRMATSTDLTPGTTICLANGTYKNGLMLKFGGFGRSNAPIKVAAQVPGKVIIQGGSASIRMWGEHVQLQGFILDSVEYNNNLIETRVGNGIKDRCFYCRITELTINNSISKLNYSNIIRIDGDNIWLDHSIISGKDNKGPMIYFNRRESQHSSQDNILDHLTKNIIVYKNYIANRYPNNKQLYPLLSDNGFEAIQTGLSGTAQYPGKSSIVANFFENIQGENEIISNKGSYNKINNNTIVNSYGSITNRHGTHTEINNNFIFGKDYPLSGGIRLADSDHTVTNNYIEGIRFIDSINHGGIVLLSSDGSLPGESGYQPANNIFVAHNTIVDSVNSFNFDGGRGLNKPINNSYIYNIIDHGIGHVFQHENPPIESLSYGNFVYSNYDSISSSYEFPLGYQLTSSILSLNDNDKLFRPSTNSPNLEVSSPLDIYVNALNVDMDGQHRSLNTSIGADETSILSKKYFPLTFDNVGPITYRVSKPTSKIQSVNIESLAFSRKLTYWDNYRALFISGNDAFDYSGSLKLLDGGYVAQSIELEADTNYELSAFVRGAFKISIGGIAELQGLSPFDDYTWVRIPFKSDENQITNLMLETANVGLTTILIPDRKFEKFTQNNTKSANWITFGDKDSSQGSVTSYSTSFDRVSQAVRLGFEADGILKDFSIEPGIEQTIKGLPLNKDYTFSLYFCDLKGEQSLSTLHFGVKDTKGKLMQGTTAHIQALDQNQVETKGCFNKVTMSFNNGNHKDLIIFVSMIIDIDDLYTDWEIFNDDQFNNDALQIFISDLSLDYISDSSDVLSGYFDDVRIIKRIK